MSDLEAGILLAIVSALVNGLIVGGVILFFEYRIKRRFAEFEKILEREAFEHETRFTKLHEKRAEVVAEFYKRLARIKRTLDDIVRAMEWELSAERLAQNEIGSSDSVRSTTESYEPVEFAAQSSAWQSVSHVFPSSR